MPDCSNDNRSRGGAMLQAARLVLLPDAPDAMGEPRITLALSARATGRRAALVIFPTITAALAAKRDMEAAR